MSSGSKPDDHDRLAVVRRDELERPRADDRRHVPGPDEAVEPQVGRVEQRAQRRHDRHVVAHDREVGDALGLRALAASARSTAPSSRSRSRRRRPRGRGSAWRSAARRAASRPSARRRPRPSPRADVPCDPGTRIMSPKQVKITPGSCARAMPSSTRPIGITHTGQPGPWTSSTFSGQQVVDAVLVDRVRVAAADLHHLVVAARLDDREDLAGQRAAQLRVAELVDVLQAAPLPIAVPACTSSSSPGATGATSAISTVVRSPALVLAQAPARASASTRALAPARPRPRT